MEVELALNGMPWSMSQGIWGVFLKKDIIDQKLPCFEYSITHHYAIAKCIFCLAVYFVAG